MGGYARSGYAPGDEIEGSGPGGQLAASDIYNDSDVSGDSVKDALNNISSSIIERYEIIELTAQHIANGSISLADTPSGIITFIIESANMQLEDRSWAMSGSTVSWAGKDIDGILEIGDVIGIKYKIN